MFGSKGVGLIAVLAGGSKPECGGARRLRNEAAQATGGNAHVYKSFMSEFVCAGSGT